MDTIKKYDSFWDYFFQVFLYEDWSLVKPWAKKILYPAWVVKSFLYWITLPIWYVTYKMRSKILSDRNMISMLNDMKRDFKKIMIY